MSSQLRQNKTRSISRMQDESSIYLSGTIIAKYCFSLRNTLNLTSSAFLLNKVVVQFKFLVVSEETMTSHVSLVHEVFEDKLITDVCSIPFYRAATGLLNDEKIQISPKLADFTVFAED